MITANGFKQIRAYTFIVMLVTVCVAQAGSMAHVIVTAVPFHWLPVAVIVGGSFPLLNASLALGGMVSQGGPDLRRKYILAAAFFVMVETLFNYVEAYNLGFSTMPTRYALALGLPYDFVVRGFSLLAGALLPLMALALTYFLVKEGEASGGQDGPDANRGHYANNFDRVFEGTQRRERATVRTANRWRSAGHLS